MKKFIHTSLLLLGILSFCNLASADVGVTHKLKQKRAKLISQIEKLKNDSVDQRLAIDSLYEKVLVVDDQIMASYDETVDRLAAKNRDYGTDSRLIVYLALISIGIALFLFILLITARRHLYETKSVGLRGFFSQLTSDFVSSVSHESASNKSILRVNVVVVLSLVLMSISVLAFLLRTL